MICNKAGNGIYNLKRRGKTRFCGYTPTQYSAKQNESVSNPGEILQAMSRVLIEDFLIEDGIVEKIDTEDETNKNPPPT